MGNLLSLGSDSSSNVNQTSSSASNVIGNNNTRPNSTESWTSNFPHHDLNQDQHHIVTNQSSDLNNLITNSTSAYNPNGNLTSTAQNSDDFIITIFGYDVKPYQWFDWASLGPWLVHLSSIAMVIGCVMPYVPQYWTIHKTHNSSGFSTLVCLALLIANITRVAFWFGMDFHIALLVQSAVMILTQLLLLELCVRVAKRYTNSEKTLFNSGLRNFWAWTDLLSYIEILILYCFAIGTATYFLKENLLYVQSIGFFSTITESMLAMPQLIKNFMKKSVLGLSVGMVLMWLLGDTYKLVYFILNNQPFQFKLCGMLQITIDILILIQIFLYRRKNTDLKLTMRDKSMVAL